ncbi:hypothetical protein POG22_04490 [Geitlerinema sp. CS-897]|nr:hypothetical protein [Geitlerinema sp. CS-897]
MGVTLVWLLFGLAAQYSFPFSTTFQLIKCLFSGNLKEQINITQKNIQDNLHIQKGLLYTEDSKNKVKDLSKLDSQYWLVTKLIEILSMGASETSSQEEILNFLNFYRAELLEELIPLQKQYYPLWSYLTSKESSRSILLMDSLVTKLYANYTQARDNVGQASSENIEELILDFEIELRQLKDKMRNQEYLILQKFYYLLDWISQQNLGETIDNSKKKQVESSVIGNHASKKYHVKYGCADYKRLLNSFQNPREDSSHIELMTSPDIAENCGLELCKKCKEKINKL